MDNDLQTEEKEVAFNRTHQAIEAERMLRRIKDDFPDNPEAMANLFRPATANSVVTQQRGKG